MDKYLSSVKEFHDTFNHPVNETKETVLNHRQLRIKLLFEELEELSEASDVRGTFTDLCKEVIDKNGSVEDGDDVDRVEEIDALCDIQYVLSGACLTLGHWQNFGEAFDNVHSSNMSKLCSNMDQVNDTINYYVNDRGMDREDIIHSQLGDNFIVNRKSDMKVLKNVHYKPADMKKYI